MSPKKYLCLAAQVSRLKLDDRTYFLGGVGLRTDGVLVSAYNGAPKYPEPLHHCEFRLCRKLDKGSLVFVARTLVDGTWANAKPCKHCENRMRAKGVSCCFYTERDRSYGCLIF